MSDETPCDSNGCEIPAMWRVYWPGQASNKCDACKRQSEAVASAMGFRLSSAALKLAGVGDE